MSINIRNKEVLVKFGERLKSLRIAKGMTQEELAFAADIELSQVHRLESAKTNATLSTLTAISLALEVTLSQLFEGV
jgi:transcriptional regulator with XRE-family HTH domain